MDKRAGYFNVGDLVRYGKYKNKAGKIVRMFLDEKGHPTVEIEPIPKGRKQNKTMGMFKFWHAPDPETLTEKTAMTSPLIKRIVDKVQGQTREARMVERVVAKAKAAGLGETVERGTVRIHRFRGVFKVWDLTNAGKRGKTVKVMTVSPNIRGDEEAWMQRMEDAMNLSEYDTYGEVWAFFADLLEQFPGEVRINETTERGVDVIPANVHPIKTQWKVPSTGGLGDIEIRLQATPLDFLLVNSVPFASGPARDQVSRQDTMYYPKSKKDAAVFYSWAATNEAQLKKMDMEELRTLWRELGIRYDYH